MDHIKAEKRAYIVLSVAQFALGAYLIARPEQSFSIACYAKVRFWWYMESLN